MNINRVEFMVTYQCSGKCKHCSVGDKRADTAKHVKPDKAAETIEKLSELFEIESVMTFGGEPLLYPDVVFAIHNKAAACGIQTRQLITNGYFSKSHERRNEVAQSLACADVNNMLISVDVFHQETIPWEDVHDFARAVTDESIPDVRLHPSWVVNEENDNQFNTATRQILAKFADLSIPVSAGNNIFMSGNAVRYLADYYEKPQLDLSESCGSRPYTEALTDIKSLSIVPNGDVAICNFAIGNIYKEDIAAIVSRYDPYKNECMRALLTGGAPALIAYAESLGITIDTENCYSVCDVCRAAAGYASQNHYA